MPNPNLTTAHNWLDHHLGTAAQQAAGDLDASAKLAADELALLGATHHVLEVGDGHSYAVIAMSLDTLDPRIPDGLLVALPEFNGCLVLDPYGFHVPAYIGEKLQHTRVRDSGIAVLAAWTTLLSAYLEAAKPRTRT